ncbi:MAG: YcaQ family DNA glycosylase [Anaerolineae bacterium]|nr:YcaQ family DNA glycosylase [Anaerolineae bacterium]
MPASTHPIPVQVARTVALHTQHLAQSPFEDGTPVTPPVIEGVIRQLGALQIDTLQMVQRSHYLALWSRLGTYQPADLDVLVYGSGNHANDRRCFEYWFHAACIIPLEDYRYCLPRMRHYREDPNAWHNHWLAEPGSAEVLAAVQEQVEQEGGQRASDFDGPKGGSWWGWKPAKRALEIHFNRGQMMIADRVNFQRVYDLTERVLPDWVEPTEPTTEEAQAFFVTRGVKALGLCEPLQSADYTHMKRTVARPIVEGLIAEGVLLEVETALADGSTTTMVIHRDNLPLLEQALDGALTAQHTTFLSPFDSLFWPARRDMQLWGFEQTLEAYKPPEQRRWGYFCLPILHRGRLVGRFDPKLDRKTGTLYLRALYLEPGIAPDESLVADVAATLRDFLRFHAASEVIIERSDPAEFGAKLMAAL